MCAQGFYEAETLAFYADADLDMLHIAADAPERKVIRILNPISSHLTIMRPLLAPSLLNVVVDNLRKGNAEDLGGPAVFLASEASDFVNGLILYVDGGILAYIGKQPG